MLKNCRSKSTMEATFRKVYEHSKLDDRTVYCSRSFPSFCGIFKMADVITCSWCFRPLLSKTCQGNHVYTWLHFQNLTYFAKHENHSIFSSATYHNNVRSHSRYSELPRAHRVPMEFSSATVKHSPEKSRDLPSAIPWPMIDGVWCTVAVNNKAAISSSKEAFTVWAPCASSRPHITLKHFRIWLWVPCTPSDTVTQYDSMTMTHSQSPSNVDAHSNIVQHVFWTSWQTLRTIIETQTVPWWYPLLPIGCWPWSWDEPSRSMVWLSSHNKASLLSQPLWGNWLLSRIG